MNRDDAFEELKLRLSNKDVLLHSIAVEAVMKNFARHYNADVDIWGLAGLLHDIDYEKTVNNPSLHGIVGADILENLGIDDSIVYSVRAHNNFNGILRKRKMDKILYLAAPLCDLIVKSAQLDNKKISDVSVESILKKIDEQNIVEDVSKDSIKYYEELGITIEEFVRIALNAIREIQFN